MELKEENNKLRKALEQAQQWAAQIANDERVCDWIHGEDYNLYCFLADCPVDFTIVEN